LHIVSVEGVSKSYKDKPLFEDTILGINDKDRIGLVGINGTGKSTFLKIIAKITDPDKGKVVYGQNISIKYLPQTPELDENMTALEHILSSEKPLIRAIRMYETAASQLEKDPENTSLQNKLSQYGSEIDALEGWNSEFEAKSILDRLGVKDTHKKIRELSGGMRKRIALAESLIQPSDLLILDEPTNHIDLDTIKWLEDYLKNRKGALLLVTHDRYFLNRIINRILEIDKGHIYSYEGNFEYFLEKKTLRQQSEASAEEKRRRLFLNELSWIRRGAKARTTKQKARIKRFEEIKESIAKPGEEELQVPVAYTRLGKKVIEINNVFKSYDEVPVIKNLSTIILRDDRIGIVGPNGSGKTTLLNLISGIISPDGGSIDIGETVKIAYYRQNNEDMDSSIRVIDYIKQTAEYVETKEGRIISASQMLDRLLFEGSHKYSLIKNLSGGERRRLLMAKILMEKPNVLLLDEPTNDLDIQTLEILEEYIEYFEGAVLIASHDRYFLDKTANKILAIKPQGKIEFFNDLDLYFASLNPIQTKETSVKTLPSKLKNTYKETAANKVKLTYLENKELSLIDDEIEDLENKLKEITKEMETCWSDFQKTNDLSLKYKTSQEELDKKMQRWVYLNEKAERSRET
jgi:ABC transport system ATP-binding/permease protein